MINFYGLLKNVFKTLFIFSFQLIVLSSFAQQYEWAKKLGNTGPSETSSSIFARNGNLFATGSFLGTVDFDLGINIANITSQNLSTSDAFFAKYDSDGNYIWAKSIGGIYSTGMSIGIADCYIDQNDNIYLIGAISHGTFDFDPNAGVANIVAGSTTAFFAKYDANGNYLWVKTFYNALGRDITVDNNSNILITGNFSGYLDFDPSSNTAILNSNNGIIFFAKYDNNGNYIWAKNIVTSSWYYGAYTRIGVDLSGDVFLFSGFSGFLDFDPPTATTSINSNGNEDLFLSKYDSNGGFLWVRQIGGTTPDVSGDLEIDALGNPVITGMSSAIFGTTGVSVGSIAKWFIAKYNTNGIYQWGNGFSTGGASYLPKLSLDSQNDIYVFGANSGSVDYDPSLTETYNLSGSAFFAKYTATGSIAWAKSIVVGARDISVDANKNVFLTGTFANTTDFNAGTDTANMTSIGSSDVFIAKYNPCLPITVNSSASICQGGTYVINSQFQTTSGIYTQRFNTKLGCDSVVTLTLTVNPLPTITITASSNAVCIGNNVSLTASGANTYLWTGGITNGINFSPTSTQTFTVTATDSNACVKTATKQIVVNPLPNATTSSISNTKCSGSCNGTATVVSVSGGQPPYTYQWDINTGNQTSAIATNLCKGTYSVQINDANNCSVTKVVEISSNTIANANIYLTNLAAVSQTNVSPAFAAYYSYNLPLSITPPSSNPRNFVDPGKRVRFKVECTNQKINGQSIVSGLCKVRTNSPYITVIDSTSALNNVGWNNTTWSSDEFEIEIAPNTPSGINAYIDFVVIENNMEYATTCIAIPIRPLDYSPTTSTTIDDDDNPDSHGNDNDICEPNEVIEFYPWLNNVSSLNAEYVRGRFENLDNLSYVNIWNNKAGVGTTVYDATWWNYAFAKPQTINSNSINTTPEYDFVFDYANANTVNNFKLYMVMAGGFNLFSGNGLSLVQWTLPFTFNSTGATGIDSELKIKEYLIVYPNPTNDFVTVENINHKSTMPYNIINSIGKTVLVGQLVDEKSIIDIRNLTSGIYFLQIGGAGKQSFKLIKK